MNTKAKITSLEIKNFRGFDHLKIEKLSKINIFVGRNSIGKTSLLEALWILTGKNAENVLRLNLFRRFRFSGDKENFIYPFHQLNKEKEPTFIYKKSDSDKEYKLVLKLIDKNTQKTTDIDIKHFSEQNSSKHIHGFKLEFYEQNEKINESTIFSEEGRLKQKNEIIKNFIREGSCIFIRTFKIEHDAVSKVITDDKKKELIFYLNQIHSDIENLEMTGDDIYVKIKNSPKFIPIHFMGDGVIKILAIYCSLYFQEKKFAVIDEIENGLHYRSQPFLWKIISQLSSTKDIDIFISTHSYEVIKYLVEFLQQEENKKYRDLFMIHTLFKNPNHNNKLDIISSNYSRFSEKIQDESEIRGLK